LRCDDNDVIAEMFPDVLTGVVVSRKQAGHQLELLVIESPNNEVPVAIFKELAKAVPNIVHNSRIVACS
jgi:hypothetical protein